MTYKDTYFIEVWDTDRPDVRGVGECNLFAGLSADDKPDFESRLDTMCSSGLSEVPSDYSALIFGAEVALADLRGGGRRILAESEWTAGTRAITINGLVWMGDKQLMSARIAEKLTAGYKCVKLKIGGIDFEEELSLLEHIRRQYSKSQLEIRLDANGAFTADNVMQRLEALSAYDIHSIEQPVRAGQHVLMADVCRNSPIPIALDEELIGTSTMEYKRQLLGYINPAYIILKPALCGGLSGADQWIAAIGDKDIGWWATSALESNIGLNAIAQWLASAHDDVCYSMPQGLGTGALYHNNIPSPISLDGQHLVYSQEKRWGQIL